MGKDPYHCGGRKHLIHEISRGSEYPTKLTTVLYVPSDCTTSTVVLTDCTMRTAHRQGWSTRDPYVEKKSNCKVHSVLFWNQMKCKKKKNSVKGRSRACQRHPKIFTWGHLRLSLLSGSESDFLYSYHVCLNRDD